jgi:hypothetical protein
MAFTARPLWRANFDDEHISDTAIRMNIAP